jgi:hypothetical protein
MGHGTRQGFCADEMAAGYRTEDKDVVYYINEILELLFPCLEFSIKGV